MKTTTPGELAAAIKTRATALGFDLCGIAAASRPVYHDAYKAWIECGFHGEMQYLCRQEPKRAAPDLVMENARTVVVVALNYYTGEGEDGSPDAMIARYARFDDYHETVKQRLGQLLEYIGQVAPQVRGKAYCDTGPISERDFAMRAGIGWIGKHTNLISRKLGNWFFLGEIILDTELPADTPESGHCGTCTRCIPACPTGAIVAPYQLDARRCISYLTIELKGSIPIELRPLIGNRVFGCDDCLAACPWNKFAKLSHDDAVAPAQDLKQARLLDLLCLTDIEFAERFRRSAIKRTKRRGLIRNVCVALGNVGDAEALPGLAKLCADRDPLIAEHAAWAAGEIRRRTVYVS